MAEIGSFLEYIFNVAKSALASIKLWVNISGYGSGSKTRQVVATISDTKYHIPKVNNM